jgi:uncharacterized protein YjbJ (UPF0337 family)
MSTGKTLLALCTGLAAGAALGILFAPDKGSETRRKLMGAANDLSGNALDKVNEGLDKFKSTLISPLRIKGNWNEIKGVLKKQFSTLTDSDLTYISGKEDELIGRLQSKLGKTKDDIIEIINKATHQIAEPHH